MAPRGFFQVGLAFEDVLKPDRLVFGTDSDWATDRLHELYAAMMINHANNAFLASKVSLANDLGNVCKAFGLEAYEVMSAVGLDDRISELFLRSGVGWGGSCFPKDVAALIAAAADAGTDPGMLEAAEAINDRQPERLLELLEAHVDLDGARIAVLGLAFKPHTDDTRTRGRSP